MKYPTHGMLHREVLRRRVAGAFLVAMLLLCPGAAAPIGQDTSKALHFDSQSLEYHGPSGESSHAFKFRFSNTSLNPVTITRVTASCGCTTAKLPPLPWELAPNQSGTFDVVMDLTGKYSAVAKSLTLETSAGPVSLAVKAWIGAPGTEALMMTEDQRMINQGRAARDRQAVFKQDCASCHVAPALGKTGGALFVAACSICHESPQRASMVPDLRAVSADTAKADYWRAFIAEGKEGTLMPAFSKSRGGPLDEEQIDSLVRFLVEEYRIRSSR